MTTTHDRSSNPRLQVGLRIIAALFLGYALTWGFIALGTAGLFALGMAFHDAEHLSVMLGFLVYLCAFLWSFAAKSLSRVWLVLAGGGAVMTICASLLQRSLV